MESWVGAWVGIKIQMLGHGYVEEGVFGEWWCVWLLDNWGWEGVGELIGSIVDGIGVYCIHSFK